MLFATEKFRSAFGSLFRAFADNLCSKVVDAPANRLSITGFSVEKGGEKLANEAWAMWLANRMDLRAGEVHTEALTSGDAYVIVWPDDDGQPIIYPNDAAMNYRSYIDNQASRLYYLGQQQPFNIFNPFAWAQFIKAWKEGKFKSQEERLK